MKEKLDKENEQNKNPVNYIDMIRKFGIPYGGKLWWGGNVGESPVIRQTKTIQNSTYN